MQTRLALSAVLVAAVLAGCAVPRSTEQTPAPVTAPAPSGPTLQSERDRLADALAGTPVVVEMTDDGRLRVQVPLEFSFDRGRAAVKPPLAAVLDRVSTGLRRQNTVEVTINGPTDANGAGGLLMAQDRAGSARDYLVARGVSPTRFAKAGRFQGDAIELVMRDKAQR